MRIVKCNCLLDCQMGRLGSNGEHFKCNDIIFFNLAYSLHVIKIINVIILKHEESTFYILHNFIFI
jgi:hypothetical protein